MLQILYQVFILLIKSFHLEINNYLQVKWVLIFYQIIYIFKDIKFIMFNYLNLIFNAFIAHLKVFKCYLTKVCCLDIINNIMNYTSIYFEIKQFKMTL